MATTPKQKTSKTTTNQSESPLSLVIAKNKLKEVEDKIYEARNRIDILHKRYQRQQSVSLNRTRAEGFRDSIRDFSSMNKSVKYDYLNRKSAQVMNYREKNMERRNQHKQKLQQMKEMIQTQNKWVYEHIRKEKQMNLRSINKAKQKQQEDKRKRRDQMFESSQRRIAYLKEYMKNKHLAAKLQKEEEASQIQAKIIQREKILAKLERKGSELSVNPQQMQKSRSIQRSHRSATKGFRTSSKKNTSALQQ